VCHYTVDQYVQVDNKPVYLCLVCHKLTRPIPTLSEVAKFVAKEYLLTHGKDLHPIGEPKDMGYHWMVQFGTGKEYLDICKEELLVYQKRLTLRLRAHG
jgi:hypothetical protein